MVIIRVTLKDIAKELGVSVNTVSKALNDKSKVSKELKEKIQETAENLGYDTAVTLYKSIFENKVSERNLKINPIVILKSNYKNYL